jgi:hypothetical protein
MVKVSVQRQFLTTGLLRRNMPARIRPGEPDRFPAQCTYTDKSGVCQKTDPGTAAISDPYSQQVLSRFFHVPVRIIHALVVKFRPQGFDDEVEYQACGKVADLLIPFAGKVIFDLGNHFASPLF